MVEENGVNAQPYDRMDLGPVIQDRSIRSSLGPFHKVDARVYYPETVVAALAGLYGEYCQSLRPPVRGIEWDTDYQSCNPPAFAVQIDMMGLEQSLLDELAGMPVDEVMEALRVRIFEVESSIAMYALLERLFMDGGRSAFADGWRPTLDNLRENSGGRPVALVAVTQERYEAMLESEFGMSLRTRPDPTEVKRVTGFDEFFGPDEFREMVRAHGGDCPFLLFVRASDPIDKLRKPNLQVEHPLLGDAEMRRVIRANAVTLNVDDPCASWHSWVNDTKAYMPTMGLGYALTDWEDLEFPEFELFLKGRGIAFDDVSEGRVALRFKPLVAAYGGYGHLRGMITDGKLRASVRSNLRKRGGYIVQPEMPTSMIVNTANNMEAGYIDRVFFGWVNGRPMPICGFRNFMPAGSGELEAGRIHGNGQAFWAEILLR